MEETFLGIALVNIDVSNIGRYHVNTLPTCLLSVMAHDEYITGHAYGMQITQQVEILFHLRTS